MQKNKFIPVLADSLVFVYNFDGNKRTVEVVLYGNNYGNRTILRYDHRDIYLDTGYHAILECQHFLD